MTNLKEAALAAMLTIGAPGAGAQDNHDHHHGDHVHNNDGAEFQLPIIKGDKIRVVPIDCDLLDQNGKMTSKFVKSIGNKSHLAREDYLIKMEEGKTGIEISDIERAHRYLEHITQHSHLRGLTMERLEVATKHCRDNYLEPEQP